MSSEFYEITIDLVDLGQCSAILLRGGAPLTIQMIFKKMQDKFIAGRARWVDFTKKDAFYFDIGIKRGKEGQFSKLKQHEMGYSYKLDSIIISLADDAEIPYDVVKIGEIKDNFEILGDLKNGTSVKMKLME
ncbi:MAG: hypothetical protein ACFFCS_29975 [Candidatus Hodarchaeota archaeon]